MGTTLSRDLPRQVRTPAYVFLWVMLLLQGLELAVGVMPLQPGSVVWRFTTAGSFVANAGNMILLIMLLYWLGLTFTDRFVIAAVGVVTGVLALLLFAGAASFVLDALQLRGKVDPSGMRKFNVASAQVLLKFLLDGVVSLLFAVSSFRSFYAASRELARDKANEVVFVTRPDKAAVRRAEPPAAVAPASKEL
jgi:hypothetical protein